MILFAKTRIDRDRVSVQLGPPLPLIHKNFPAKLPLHLFMNMTSVQGTASGVLMASVSEIQLLITGLMMLK